MRERVTLVDEADVVDEHVDFGAQLARRHALEPSIEFELLLDAHIVEDDVVLRTNAEKIAYCRHLAANIAPVDERCAVRRRVEAAKQRHRRRLAGAVVAEEAGDLILVEAYVKRIERLHIIIVNLYELDTLDGRLLIRRHRLNVGSG